MNLLYIDPGTGSMIFSAIIALATTLVFGVRALAIKLKFVFQGGGKNEKIDKANQGIVIFSDDKRYWNVFAPICVEAEKRGINLVYMTQSADDPALSEKFQHVKCEFIGEGNKGFTKLNFLNADIVLSTTPHLDVYQWKRSKNVKFYVHIPHAIDDLMGYRMFGTDSYDAILTCGEFAENWLRRLEKMRGIKQKELVVVGYPPLDEQKIRLESEHNVVASEPLAASEACGKTKQSKTILVAPSWGKSAILSRYGEKFLSSLVATGYKIVVRPHPQSKTSEKEMLDTLMKKFPQNENFLWNFDNDNFLAMKNADLLITDFSGIIFDFAFIFDKPVFYADATFDSAIYDAAWFPGEERTFIAYAKKIGIKLEENQFSDIKTAIDNALLSEELSETRHQVRDEIWQHEGEAAKRVVDYLVQKQAERGTQC